VRAAVGEEPELEVQSLAPPLSAAGDAPVIRELLDLTGQEEAGAVSYATDAGWLAELGLDCAVFGPGSIEVAHKPNESVPKADLVRAREVLEAMIERFCRRAAAAEA
jgi:acetylornithine deacetylase